MTQNPDNMVIVKMHGAVSAPFLFTAHTHSQLPRLARYHAPSISSYRSHLYRHTGVALVVIPAQAGIHCVIMSNDTSFARWQNWIPRVRGMTEWGNCVIANVYVAEYSLHFFIALNSLFFYDYNQGKVEYMKIIFSQCA